MNDRVKWPQTRMILVDYVKEFSNYFPVALLKEKNIEDMPWWSYMVTLKRAKGISLSIFFAGV